jgi:hypothetical protein
MQHTIERDEERVQEHHLELEAVLVQLRALGACVEQLAGVVEEVGRTLPAEASADVARRLEEIRWALRRIG